MTGIKGVKKKKPRPRAGTANKGKVKIRLKSAPKQEPAQKPFNFFGLPRELRDLVYQELLVGLPEDFEPDGHFSYTEAHGFANRDLLLVNHQFSDEYQVAEKACTTFMLSGFEETFVWSRHMPGLDYIWARVTQLHIVAVISIDHLGPQHGDEVSHWMWLTSGSYIDWLTHTFSMLPKLRHFKVTGVVYRHPGCPVTDRVMISSLQNLTQIPRLDVLELYDTIRGIGEKSIKPGIGHIDASRIKWRWTAQDPVIRRADDHDRAAEVDLVPVPPWIDRTHLPNPSRIPPQMRSKLEAFQPKHQMVLRSSMKSKH